MQSVVVVFCANTHTHFNCVNIINKNDKKKSWTDGESPTDGPIRQINIVAQFANNNFAI